MGEEMNVGGAQEQLELAYAAEERGDWDEALAYCERAIQLDPGLADAHNYCGVVLEQLGRLEEAIAAYDEALRIAPEFVEAQENLKEARRALGQSRIWQVVRQGALGYGAWVAIGQAVMISLVLSLLDRAATLP